MEQLTRLGEKVLDAVIEKTGFETLIILLVAALFAFLYHRERVINKELTTMLLSHSETHAGKFVDVVTSGIETDNRLASAINQLTVSIETIREKIDRIVGSNLPNRRR